MFWMVTRLQFTSGDPSDLYHRFEPAAVQVRNVYFRNISVYTKNRRFNMRINIYIQPQDENLVERAKIQARRKRTSLSGVLLNLLEEWVERSEHDERLQQVVKSVSRGGDRG